MTANAHQPARRRPNSNRVHHLTGPEALTMDQIAAALTRHLP